MPVSWHKIASGALWVLPSSPPVVAQVYDFALPLLILHAFTFKTMDNLKHWLNICPRRQITVLDTHDGMGIDDIAGLAEVALPARTRHPAHV